MCNGIKRIDTTHKHHKTGPNARGKKSKKFAEMAIDLWFRTQACTISDG